MTSHLIDSTIFADQYGTEEMRNVFSDDNRVMQWLRVEIALARAEVKLDLVPVDAFLEIERQAKVEHLSFSNLKAQMEFTDHPIMPVIQAVQHLCNGIAGEYFHWGATTQDILDTGFILQIKEALEIIFRDLRETEGKLLEMMKNHRDTLMVSRTHGQHALPFTFGFKIAGWVREIRRDLDRLKECQSRLLVGQLAGAVGTFASFGEKGPEIQRLVMEELGLGVPDICWHSSRDRIGELGCVLSLIANTYGRIANELYALQKTEFMEIEEHFHLGKVGSSTMPHKRNPSLCEGIISLAKLIQGSALTTLESMWIDHERDSKYRGVEWLTISESMILMSSLLDKSKRLFGGLQIKENQMLRNLEISKGLIFSEPIMLSLGKKLGRQKAHEVIYRISMEVFEKGMMFKEALINHKELKDYFTESEIDTLLDARRYTGLSRQIVDEMLDLTEKERGRDDAQLVIKRGEQK